MEMTITLKIAKEEDKELWDSLVEKSSHGTLFHTWKFLKIVEKHTESKLYPIIGLKGTTPIGIYPLFLQKRFFTKIVLSPPQGALLLYLGPAIVDYDKLKQSKKESTFVEFQRKVNEFLKSEINYNYVRIRTSPDLIDSRPFLWTDYNVELLYTYIIDINKGTQYVWKNFNKQLRIDVNKTKREGVKVKGGSKRELKYLRISLAERFIEQGYKTSDYSRYLLDVYKAFYPENMRIFVGEYNGETVGGLALLSYKDKVSLWIGIPKTDLEGIYPNDLIVWESIMWACENNYKRYEIMDAGHNPRLRHFKSKFNPELSPWYSAEKYSSIVYKGMEKAFRFYQGLRR